MPILRLAFDKSARHIDADGRLHVDRSHISKATVNPYYGKEIPGFDKLGLDPTRVYHLFRDPVELERGAATFARLPILSSHVPVTVDSVADDPELKKLIVGAIGSNITFDSPYLDADLCVWDKTSISDIDSDTVRELSCAYRYVPVMESGEFEGQPYDGRMTEIQGNHLALVETGRAGSDVVVADHNSFKSKGNTMKMTKLGKALFAAFCGLSPVLAADAALPALVGLTTRKTFDKVALRAKLLALDAEMDPGQADAIMDAMMDVAADPNAQQVPPGKVPGAVDESPADKVRAMLAGKLDPAMIEQVCALMAPPAADDLPANLPIGPNGAKDSPPGMVKKEEMAAAMDGLRGELKAAAEAARDVRSVVGDVIAQDSAADIYAFALDHMKVDHKDVTDAAALRALFKVALAGRSVAPPLVAQDSAGLAARFPNANRFGLAA